MPVLPYTSIEVLVLTIHIPELFVHICMTTYTSLSCLFASLFYVHVSALFVYVHVLFDYVLVISAQVKCLCFLCTRSVPPLACVVRPVLFYTARPACTRHRCLGAFTGRIGAPPAGVCTTHVLHWRTNENAGPTQADRRPEQK